MVETCQRAAANAGAAELFLEVAADNEAARPLYHAAGFACVGLRPAYYPSADRRTVPGDAIILRRGLGPNGEEGRKFDGRITWPGN